MKRRLTFEDVQLHREARACVRDLHGLGTTIGMRGVLSYWRGVARQYRMGPWRWLDGCRFARERRMEEAR